MFKLIKHADRVYHLQVTNRTDLCMMFLRYQEFYECENTRFCRQSFTLAEYMSWYTRKMGEWSYVSDWCGFNFPLRVIKECHDAKITDPNMYDSLMIGIHGMIDCIDTDSYLIGSTPSDDASDHEFTHAMFYVNEQYKQDVLRSIAQVKHLNLYKNLCETLKEEGYAPHVYDDEINAYLSDPGYTPEFIEKHTDTYGFTDLKTQLCHIRSQYFEVK